METLLAYFVLVSAAVASQGGDDRMTRPLSAPNDCRVQGVEQLLGGITRDVICSEIRQAMAKHAPGADYGVEVRIASPSRLSAVIVVNGRALPVQKLAVSDGTIGRGSIHRFAETLAAMAKTR